MKTILVLHNQSLLDICLKLFGNLTGLFALAYTNDLSITDDLEAGAVLVIPDVETANTDVVNYYDSKNIIPASALTREQIDRITNQLEGIDYWAIGIDFIVQ